MNTFSNFIVCQAFSCDRNYISHYITLRKKGFMPNTISHLNVESQYGLMFTASLPNFTTLHWGCMGFPNTVSKLRFCVMLGMISFPYFGRLPENWMVFCSLDQTASTTAFLPAIYRTALSRSRVVELNLKMAFLPT